MNLSNVDIITVNCTDPIEGIKAIRHCCKSFKFGRMILFTDQNVESEGIERIKINRLHSVDEYNDFILSLNEFINNDYVMIVQDDGFIVNPSLWDWNFLNYDYIGAPWPSVEDTIWIGLQNPKIRPHMDRVLPLNRTGNGGFSLRSKRFLEYSNRFKTCDGVGEDSFLCIQNYEEAISAGLKFAPFDLALKFSHEIAFDKNNKKRDESGGYFDIGSHFGFHGRNFINREQIISLKDQ